MGDECLAPSCASQLARTTGGHLSAEGCLHVLSVAPCELSCYASYRIIGCEQSGNVWYTKPGKPLLPGTVLSQDTKLACILLDAKELPMLVPLTSLSFGPQVRHDQYDCKCEGYTLMRWYKMCWHVGSALNTGLPWHIQPMTLIIWTWK